MRVPLGSSISELVFACGGAEDGWAAFHNGALAGRLVDQDATVDLDTRGFTIVPPRHALVLRATTPLDDLPRRCAASCTNCRVCTEICPAWLNGATLEPHTLIAALGRGRPTPEQGADALGCLDCGLCDAFCPASLQPARLIASLRSGSVVDREAHAEAASSAPLPAAERAGRRISIARLTDSLGLRPYARLQIPTTSFIPQRLMISLITRSGAPFRDPMVSVGEYVARGALIARDRRTADRGVFAPVDGRIASIDDERGVVIDVQ